MKNKIDKAIITFDDLKELSDSFYDLINYDDGYDFPIQITLSEKAWRLISKCMKFVRDQEILCEDCQQDLFCIHQDLCDQVIKCLESELEDNECS